MMRYIQRNEDGEVVAHFACEQTYAREAVAADHPDILAFKTKRDRNRLPRPGESFREIVSRVEAIERRLDAIERRK